MYIGEGEREEIRRAYYVERKSQRQIARESGRSREAVKQIVEGRVGMNRERKKEKEGVYAPYRERVEAFLEENEHLPPKQR
ncbi:hypothetical protein KSC_028180 [Ktedonobacter sp. SOSP1-52]|uniref:hypothetical protein n=1 Tax=Ktedonobacter sp. SOSP1-52 TaxID=2778366 RepID=UPI0019151F2D|nr:hypothetical protein [Ktedonobacter sp. SOSP1-52]GHO63926.1 hypothetical protein KSC_028180 [Ktedonobacter sp. SOSP1-52]